MRKWGRLLGVAASLGVASSALAAPARVAVVGGQPASRDYGYAAALRVTFPDTGEARCAGALISARFVVTAAHCFRSARGATPGRIQVALGNVDYEQAAYTEVPLSAYRLHPRYAGRPDEGFDVALLELPAPVPNEQLRLLRTVDAPLWRPGTQATVIGWGMTDDGRPPSRKLLEAQVPIHDDATCADEVREAGAPPDTFKPSTMLCAGGDDQDACNGDSGAPLLVPDGAGLALAGLVSFGILTSEGRSCAEGIPGIYSRIGAESLNAFVRSIVPQVELDWAPGEPQAGQRGVLRAAPSTAGGRRYDGYTWDLDADGAFDDGAGTSVPWTFEAGLNVVAVRASRGAEAEVRRVGVHAGGRSPVAFRSARVRVVEGQTAVLRLVKRGGAAGEASLRAFPGTAVLGADTRLLSRQIVPFGHGTHRRTATVRTVDDRVKERRETFAVDIAEVTGDLEPAAPRRVTVTIVDNDGRARIVGARRGLTVRRGRFSLKYRTVRGRLVIRAVDARSERTYARTARRHRSGGRYRARLRLNRAGRTALRRRGKLSLRVALSLHRGGDEVVARTARVTLRR